MSTSQKRRRSSQNVVDDADGSTGTSVEVAEPLSSCKSRSSSKGKKTTARKRSKKEGSGSGSVRTQIKDEGDDGEDRFLGEPIPESEARIRWPVRYETKRRFSKKGDRSINSKSDGDEEEILRARCHYSQAMVDGVIYNLNEDAYVKGEDGMPNYIGRIVEFFEAIDKKPYFTAQWFFKAEDTVIKTHANLIDGRRVFFSDLRDDNPLDCIISKIKIIKVAPNINLAEKEAMISECDFYYDMKYSLAYSTFVNLPKENVRDGSETSSTISAEGSLDGEQGKSQESSLIYGSQKSEMKLLDLYSGCGGMSTGLCLGARLSGVNLVTRWAVDLNPHACESLKLNHPETEVRNESADNFLNLLKEWEKLCREFSLLGTNPSEVQSSMQNDEEDDDDDATENSSEEFEVGKLIGVCYGDPNETKEPGLYFKVSWKGYGPEEDTWEPVDGLSNCREKIQDFVTNGYKSNMLPLPGDVDVVCGGPPCQGASGFNRFRNNVAPLDDEKNRQMIVYMDIVNYLKPMYVLMENVVDILKFSGGFLGRYALSRLVAMNYQARLGMMVAGCYGLPQFRMRVFLWGAHATKKLPQYPLPINEVVVRGVVPKEFEQNVVAYNEDQPLQLQKALHLGDAISDLPEITNYETRDEMPYGKAPRTEFQKQIRLSKHELLGFNGNEVVAPEKAMLHDHRPLKLNEDDYQRVCRIPKEKGANFRDLPGVLVRPDNKVEWDQSVERVLLPSGKPLVPDYAMTFVGGGSSKPFGRLWWDEIVPTVVTRAEPHNQVILHPLQDRVLSIRENARLQGFPDYYKLCGPVKERYIQIGNAVAVPVARALGYSMGLASRGECDDQPLLTLPPKFPNYLERLSTVNSMPSVEEN